MKLVFLFDKSCCPKENERTRFLWKLTSLSFYCFKIFDIIFLGRFCFVWFILRQTELYHFEVILTNNGCLGHLAPSRTLCYPHLEDNRTKENTKKVHYIFIICQKSWKPNLHLRGLGECSECQIMTLGISAKE